MSCAHGTGHDVARSRSRCGAVSSPHRPSSRAPHTLSEVEEQTLLDMLLARLLVLLRPRLGFAAACVTRIDIAVRRCLCRTSSAARRNDHCLSLRCASEVAGPSQLVAWHSTEPCVVCRGCCIRGTATLRSSSAHHTTPMQASVALRLSDLASELCCEVIHLTVQHLPTDSGGGG